jgi:Secretion system C-terminal sorting domain
MFRGSGNDSAYSIASGPAGGVVVAGSSASNDGDVTGHHGSAGVIDAWVVALRYDGQLLWEKSYGGSGADKFNRIIATTDGGYIAVGSTTSTDGDVSGLHGAGSGSTDIWVVKLDGSGNIQWQKCLGGSAQDLPGSIVQTADGGYILIGTAGSTDGDVSGSHGGNDVWVVRLDKNGNLVWQQCYGNAGGDNGYDIQPIGTFATDTGFIHLVQAESATNSVAIAASGLVPGNNVFYVRMRTSDSCYTAQTAVDSLVLVLGGDSSVMPGGAVFAEPNPFTGDLTIRGLDATKNYDISLVSIVGQIVVSQAVRGQNQSVLITGGLGRGMYYVRVYDAQTGRVVVSKALLKVD